MKWYIVTTEIPILKHLPNLKDSDSYEPYMLLKHVGLIVSLL